MDRRLALAPVTALLLAGCLTPAQQALEPAALPAFDVRDLVAADAVETIDGDGVRTFLFEGLSQAGARGILVAGPRTWQWQTAVPVDNRVGYLGVELNYTTDATDSNLIVFLIDDHNRIQCGGAGFTAPKGCTAPVPDNYTEPREWTIRVQTGFATSMPDIPFTVAAALHAPAHVTRGDPLAGTDPAITFRVSDTKGDGSEPNVGVLADGTIFVQETLQTLRSRDDGRTWEDVGPPTTSQITFDPMLRVDPWSGTVYVDQLYVGCSILAWSSDAGASWITNPAACGVPANDHQKIAVGPSPLPGFNAVYYAYSSFAQGAWVSRSLDGGLTFAGSSPVVGLTDGRVFANTGPVEADREGNVYVPYYMCDDGGYIGVGVSHDFGATFEFVEVSDEDGPCFDVDPGLAIDTDGNLYLAYHRATGVKYAWSADRGATWSEPVTVSPPSLRSFVHVDAIAGDAGRVAIAYRATPDTAKGPDAADGWASWYMYTSFVEDAMGPAPVIRTGLVSPPGDPEQRGPICTQGIACVGGSRNLLDFIDIGVGPDGRVYPVYTDGCDTACPTPADSRAALGLVGIQENGPRLFVNGAPWASGAARAAAAAAGSAGPATL